MNKNEIPMGIPTTMNKELLLSVLEDDTCSIGEAHHDTSCSYCDNIPDCEACIFFEDNRLYHRHMLIQYGIDKGWLTKGEGLGLLLDKAD